MEKNNQYGGNLQTFVRDRVIFDTGVHYIGGLGQGEHLYQYFKYLGIVDSLHFERLDAAFDHIYFEDLDKKFYFFQGFEAFTQQLIKDFPTEENAILQYVQDIKDCCASFPMYNARIGHYDNEKWLNFSIGSYIEQHFKDKILQKLLVATNFLYAGHPEQTPFYIHALVQQSYIQSAWRCEKGGSQIAKALIQQLRKYGADLFNHQEVTAIKLEDNKNAIAEIITKEGRSFKATTYISNIDPKITLDLIGAEHLKSTYYNRIQSIPATPSVFSLYLSLQSQTIPFENHNTYYFKHHSSVWAHEVLNHTGQSVPFYMVSMIPDLKHPQFASGMSVLTFMDYKDWKQWESTYNTIVHGQDRGDSYQSEKSRIAHNLLNALSVHYPTLKSNILGIYTASPLSFRDFIHSKEGAIYGIARDVNHLMTHSIAPVTKLKNLYFVGQNINLHGILGVTVGSFLTCGKLIDLEKVMHEVAQ